MANESKHLFDIDRVTGEYISGWPRIKQSILTILTTRLRTRLMRLWWGSEFLDMQDKPGNEETIMNSIMAAAEAINLYEPEFKVKLIVIDDFTAGGEIRITVDGEDIYEKTDRRVVATL
jgi:phage baseplate assembly protein W